MLKRKIQEGLDRIPRVSGDTSTGQGIYVTQRLNKLLVTAQDEAVQAVADAVIRAGPVSKIPSAQLAHSFSWQLGWTDDRRIFW